MTLNKTCWNKTLALEKQIKKLERKPFTNALNKEKIKRQLVDSVNKNTARLDKVGILFSGGVDSSLLALLASRECKTKLYTAGLKDSQDVVFSGRAAKALHLPLKITVIKENQAERKLVELVKLLKDANAMKIGVGLPFLACARAASERVLLTGGGAEELFVGYAKYRNHAGWKDLQQQLWTGLEEIAQKDLYRDCVIAHSAGKEFRTPFLDPDFVETVMSIHPKHKLPERDGQNKVLLREISVELGLPEFIAQRPKKATQYGSGMDKAIERLTRKNGFKTKQDYLESLINTKSSNS